MRYYQDIIFIKIENNNNYPNQIILFLLIWHFYLSTYQLINYFCTHANNT